VRTPVIDRLFEIAVDQAGAFTTGQAIVSGLSAVDLARAYDRGDITRFARGVYIITRFPISRDQELWAAVLFPTVRRDMAAVGVLSHETAIAFHAPECDIAPSKIDVSAEFLRGKKGDTPRVLRLHDVHVSHKERTTNDAGVPVTTLKRTVDDCLRDGTGFRYLPEMLEHALLNTCEINQHEFDTYREQMTSPRIADKRLNKNKKVRRPK